LCIRRYEGNKSLLTVGGRLESDEVAAVAVDCGVEWLDVEFIAREFIQVCEDVHTGPRRLYRHLCVVTSSDTCTVQTCTVQTATLQLFITRNYYYYYYYYYNYYYYICLTAFFQDKLGRPAPEKQNHSGKTNLWIYWSKR